MPAAPAHIFGKFTERIIELLKNPFRDGQQLSAEGCELYRARLTIEQFSIQLEFSRLYPPAQGWLGNKGQFRRSPKTAGPRDMHEGLQFRNGKRRNPRHYPLSFGPVIGPHGGAPLSLDAQTTHEAVADLRRVTIRHTGRRLVIGTNA